MERTLVIVKPDGIKRGLIGEVISRYERKGLKIVECRMIEADKATLEKHYIEHREKPFYEELVSYMMGGSIMVMIVEGNNAIKLVRNINGKTNPVDAEPGTIRGDFANTMTENIVHASDSVEAAEREISIWF
ncbi:nucleoside diphosphate kinase [Proteiniborus ethanoligenes]|uniref:Nucleoside diphosphate kinase n=1 Tax=Proteiniborus ethanoligenes TaxID=415015 RepID=A0A1H3RJ89_9FIRM|nr:nucleoside-diphosphate kinase [Proteiniborus ethanoligenes]SDZ25663.1 nucleoside diphosphate kinase [Proteiniborus ethanoligenes]